LGEYVTHSGSCHCGAVRIEVDAPPDVEAEECNCSICRRTGYLHLIVPSDRFRLVQGRESLANYMFNTGTAQHYFCRVCGCRPYYVPRSNPDGFSVNVRCLEPSTVRTLRINRFDGVNWEASAPRIAHLSKPSA